MPVVSGLNYKWAIDLDNQQGSPDFQNLPQQQDGGLSLDQARVDASHKDDAGWTRQIAVSRSVTAEVSGALEEDNTVLDFMEAKIVGDLASGRGYFQFTTDQGDTWAGWFWFSIEYQTPNGELATYSCSLESDGAVAKVEHV